MVGIITRDDHPLQQRPYHNSLEKQVIKEAMDNMLQKTLSDCLLPLELYLYFFDLRRMAVLVSVWITGGSMQ